MKQKYLHLLLFPSVALNGCSGGQNERRTVENRNCFNTDRYKKKDIKSTLFRQLKI